MTNKDLFLKSGFPRLPNKNGIGRVICQLKRITIKFCKSSGNSKGVRTFIENGLLEFTQNNPEVVIYLKPRRHHAPVIISEYLNGERHYEHISKFSDDEVLKFLNIYRSRIGVPIIRYRKLWHTEYPSIQGVWSPFTNRDPALNIATFPLDELSKPLNTEKSATEILREMFERQKLNEEVDSENEKIDVEIQEKTS